MGRINYNGHKVSSAPVRAFLEKISKLGNITVTSGDRDFVPKGGSKTSDHLHHSAVDIHVGGMSDKKLFATLASRSKEFFGNFADGVQLILHGRDTATGGPHVHIGYIAPIAERKSARLKAIAWPRAGFIPRPPTQTMASMLTTN